MARGNVIPGSEPVKIPGTRGNATDGQGTYCPHGKHVHYSAAAFRLSPFLISLPSLLSLPLSFSFSPLLPFHPLDPWGIGDYTRDYRDTRTAEVDGERQAVAGWLESSVPVNSGYIFCLSQCWCPCYALMHHLIFLPSSSLLYSPSLSLRHPSPCSSIHSSPSLAAD
jgi:hypothetical protein